MRRQNHLVSNPATQSCELFDAPKRETRTKLEFVVGLNGSAWVTDLAQQHCSQPQLHARSAFVCTRKLQSCYSTFGHTYNMLSSAAKMSRLGCHIKGALCKNCPLMKPHPKQTGRITRVNANSCYL